MPIYEYKCSDCGNVYEKRQKFSDPVDTACHCEKKAPVSRLTSAPALVFKGSGWYINDYARAGNDGGQKPGSKDGATANGAGSDSASDSSTKADPTSNSTSGSTSSTTPTTPAKAS